MSGTVFIKTYAAPTVDENEILRYAGVRGNADERTRTLLDSCLQETASAFSYRVCYCVLSANRLKEELGQYGVGELVNRRLKDAEYAVVFAASVGLEIDRLVMRYGESSPAKAVMMQAIGAERIESLCDTFCEELADEWNEKGLRIGARFSAGYGDFPIGAQKTVVKLLDCHRKIGVALTDGLMMTPTKSVTAIVPIYARACQRESVGCETCDKQDCEYKK